jgi:hypothetical protein
MDQELELRLFGQSVREGKVLFSSCVWCLEIALGDSDQGMASLERRSWLRTALNRYVAIHQK